ncbi:MAG: sugar phosphate isomerase/epimerase [Kiritimatiellaeota bacterium]|nr:sugar phosphate isomerase/epimerase [Kiritimatiellota bacterium]
MKLSLALQMYSLREMAQKDFPAALKEAAGIGYRGVEFAGLHGHQPGAIRKLLDELGLKACSAHCSAFDPQKVEQNIEEGKILGYSHVISGLGPEQFASEKTVREQADKINAVIGRYTAAGFTVCYHNHEYEYSAPNKGDLLLSLCPQLQPQFDIYWLAIGGSDPAKYIRKYAERVYTLHIKDGPCDKANRNKPMTAVGKGKVDVTAAIKAAEKTSIKWGIVELDESEGDMLTAVRESFRYLADHQLGLGR